MTPSSFVYMYRPFGSKAMAVEQINPNTKEKWYKSYWRYS